METVLAFFKPMTVVYGVMLLSLTVFTGVSAFLVQDFFKDCSKNNRWVLPASILLFAIILRLGWIILTQADPMSDFAVHTQWARAFATGNMTYTDIVRHPGIMLLYGIGMAMVGPSLWTGWMMNLLFGTISLMALYQLTKNLAGEKIALVCLGLAAVFPQAIAFHGLMATEIIGTAYILLLLWAGQQILATLEQPHTKGQLDWAWIACGILLTGALLIRSTSLLVGLAMLVMAFVFYKTYWAQLVRGVVIVALTTGLTFGTWCVHQYTLTGSLKPYWGGEIWLANAVYAPSGGTVVAYDQLPVYPAIQADLAAGTIPAEMRAYTTLGQWAWSTIQADPMGYLQLGGVRLQKILGTAMSAIHWSEQGSNTLHQWISERWVGKIKRMSTVFWQTLLVFMPLGMGILWQKRRRQGLHVNQQWLMGTLGMYLLTWVVFHYFISVGSERYGFQVFYPVLIFSGMGLNGLVSFVGDAIKRFRATRQPESFVAG